MNKARASMVCCWIGLASCLSACGLTAASDGELMGGQHGQDASIDGSSGAGSDASNQDADSAVPDIVAPDVACFFPDKVCGGECVDFDDPAYGCDSSTCEPCEAPSNAVMGCANNECAIIECEEGWESCDGDTQTGCETDVHTVKHCGGCGIECALPNANATCEDGTCGFASCMESWGDCNGNPNDGCETNLRDIFNCGSCGNTCPTGGDAPTCVRGFCEADNCDTENTGRADCDADPTDCETDVRTTEDCGACGTSCGFTGDHVAEWECAPGGSGFGCQIKACAAGWGNCDNNPATGCATNLLVSTNNCGSCGGACETTHTLSLACIGGKCEPTCANGFGDCDAPEPGATDDGCETTTSTDMSNCGQCGNVCNLPNATELCQQGVCGIASCPAGRDDCDGTVTNGCEINLLTDISNCGTCGFTCSSSGGTPSCNNGNCNVTCVANHGNCDGNTSNGCETNLTTTSDCGSCDNECSELNGTASCVPQSGSYVCQVTCNTGYADCDNNALTGCEVHATVDPDHCGACGNNCSNNHVPTPTCNASVCSGTCQNGYADCNGNKLTDGCEVNLNNNPDHCGGCSDSCSNNHMATRTCLSGNCNGTCAVGYSDCDGDLRDNGCETGTMTNVNHCGACNAPCSSTNVATRVCIDGKCDPICMNGWTDSNGPQAGTIDDGCEAPD